MSRNQLDRVVFHSKEDGAGGYYLRKAEPLLNSLDLTVQKDVNDLLELYNIKEYFDNDLFLSTWDEGTKTQYKELTNQAAAKTKRFFIDMNDADLISAIEILDFNYRRSFWQLFSQFQVYKRITNETFYSLLEAHSHQIGYILNHFNIVTHFDALIRTFLMKYNESAELLLSRFEQGDRYREVSYIFPKSLTLEDKEDILLKYINQEKPNLNYIRLIEHSVNSADLKLSVKTRLLAKKKSEELNNRIFEEGSSVRMGVQVTFDKDQDEPLKVSREGFRLDYSYSVKFLDAQPNDIALFMLFRNLFGFNDETGLTTFYSRQSEMDVMERIGMASKNEYPTGLRFMQKKQTALVQVVSFNHYLSEKNRSLEKLIQSFIHLALDKDTMISGLKLRFATSDTTFLEKIRTLAPELEFLLKQYQVFVSEGKVDFELIEIDSTPLAFSHVKSLFKKRYAYATGNKIENVKHHFYSDQSSLHYTENFKYKYSNFYDLLENEEEVKLGQFANYQQDLIRYLATEGYLTIDDEERIKMKDDTMMYLIGELHRDEVISYYHYPKVVRDILDQMEIDGMIRFEDTLFSMPEISYLNYYLNKKKFTNGLNIRNKYLHGSNSGSENEHRTEYYILLKLVIVALLKIVDDLMLRKRIAEEV